MTTSLSFRLSFKTPTFSILEDTCGSLPLGGITAILGPSGAGKTTLLRVLSGRPATATGAKITELKYANEQVTLEVLKQNSSYSPQFDSQPAQLTPREILGYTFELVGEFKRAGKNTKVPEQVDGLIAAMGLEGCQATRLGSVAKRGVSGGERKRACIANSLVGGKRLLFLDEPTTGLDAEGSSRIVRHLAALRGAVTIVATLHSPSFKTLSMFDHVIVMGKGGKVVFCGPPRELEGELARWGHPSPPFRNPADHALKVVHNREFLADIEAVRPGPGAPDAAVPESLQLRSPHDPLARPWFITQVSVLFRRGLKIFLRDKFVSYVRFFDVVCTALLGGFTFFQLKHDQLGASSILGVFFFTMFQSLLSSMLDVLFKVPEELPLFFLEVSERAYTPAAYVVASALRDGIPSTVNPIALSVIVYFLTGLRDDSAEPFFLYAVVMVLLGWCGASVGSLISTLTEDATISLAVAPATVPLMLILSGFIRNLREMTKVLSWLRWINPLKYAFSAVSLSQLRGVAFTCAPLLKCPISSGDQILALRAIDMDISSAWGNVGALFLIAAIFRAASGVVLAVKARRARAL